MIEATIIGRGPRLLELSADDVRPGPVIVLNAALETVRTWGLPNQIYSLQKDGCIIEPRPTEWVYLSWQLSRQCFLDHAKRRVFDLDAYGLRQNAMSVVLAVAVAKDLGATSARMLAFDSMTHFDNRITVGDRIEKAPRDYRPAAQRAQRYADRIGLSLEWVP